MSLCKLYKIKYRSDTPILEGISEVFYIKTVTRKFLSNISTNAFSTRKSAGYFEPLYIYYIKKLLEVEDNTRIQWYKREFFYNPIRWEIFV